MGTRNPVDSYVSRKIAQATGQWKLTNAKHARSEQAVFDAAEFEAHLEALQRLGVTAIHRRSYAPVRKLLDESAGMAAGDWSA